MCVWCWRLYWSDFLHSNERNCKTKLLCYLLFIVIIKCNYKKKQYYLAKIIFIRFISGFYSPAARCSSRNTGSCCQWSVSIPIASKLFYAILITMYYLGVLCFSAPLSSPTRGGWAPSCVSSPTSHRPSPWCVLSWPWPWWV